MGRPAMTKIIKNGGALRTLPFLLIFVRAGRPILNQVSVDHMEQDSVPYVWDEPVFLLWATLRLWTARFTDEAISNDHLFRAVWPKARLPLLCAWEFDVSPNAAVIRI